MGRIALMSALIVKKRSNTFRVIKKSKSVNVIKGIFSVRGIIVSILGLLISVYMLIVSPTKKDIRRIENVVSSRVAQRQSSLPIFVPEGKRKLNDAEIEKLEKDIKKVESSIFFSLSSETYFDIASFFFDQAKFRKAIDYVNKSIQKKPLNQKSLLLRAVLHFYTGSYKKALADTNIIIEKSEDEKAKAAARLVKGFVLSLIGETIQSQDSLLKAASYLKKTGEPKEALIICYYMIASFYFNQAAYDLGENYYFKVKAIAKQLESLEQKDWMTILLLAIINLESDFKTLIENCEKLLKINEESFFLDLTQHIYRIAISINDSETFIMHIENIIKFCQKYEIVYLEQYFKKILFEYWLDNKKSFRNDLWQEIINSPTKILPVEADMYKAAGEFFLNQEDYATALDYLGAALERYIQLNYQKDIVDTKINISHAELLLKNYFNSFKMLHSARDDIKLIFAQNLKKSYMSKRASEEIGMLKIQLDSVEKLISVIEKRLQ